jgi:hypothetical protein
LESANGFGLKATPTLGGTLAGLFDALGWISPDFELVHGPPPEWRFERADSGLHARRLVGTCRLVHPLAHAAAWTACRK